MGIAKPPVAVKLFCGIIASDRQLLSRVHAELTQRYGPLDRVGDVAPFDYTSYYADEMGPDLVRQFVAFAGLIDPGRLAHVKHETNALEQTFVAAAGAGGACRRRVNLDPGYLTPASAVLASTKSSAHRVYLGEGVYAEVTLRFRGGACVCFDWTYPDFRTPACADFLLGARADLLADLRAARRPDDSEALSGFVAPAVVLHRMRATDKAGVIEEMLAALGRRGLIHDVAAAREAVLARERQMSTGMEGGVALPHARSEEVSGLTVAVGIKPEGVAFESLDGEPARIFVLTLAPGVAAGQYLQFMAALSRRLDAARCRRLLAAATREELWTALLEPSPPADSPRR